MERTEFPETADTIVPPVAVALIDSLLHNIGEQTFIDRRKVEDMLLDVRNLVWLPNDYSLALAGVVDSNPKVVAPS